MANSIENGYITDKNDATKITHFLYTANKQDGLVTLNLAGSKAKSEEYTLKTSDGSKILFEQKNSGETDKSISAPISGTLTKTQDDTSPSGITGIGKKSFANDSALQRIILPKTLITIEEKAFENCAELQVVEMNVVDAAKQLTIQYHAFDGCGKLHTVNLGEAKSIRIEAEAFNGCCALRSIVLPKDCSISDTAFNGCDTEKLCFVVKTGSDAERYAREHDYRYVQQD